MLVLCLKSKIEGYYKNCSYTCVALMGNGIKSLFPPKYHRDRISATRTCAFGTFLHHNLYFTFYFSLFDSFTWYPLHFIHRYLPVTPFILYLFSYILFFTFYFHFLIVSRGTPFILFTVSPYYPLHFMGLFYYLFYVKYIFIFYFQIYEKMFLFLIFNFILFLFWSTLFYLFWNILFYLFWNILFYLFWSISFLHFMKI